jgi:hypothetical protein
VKQTFAIGAVLGFALVLLSGCGEKPCNSEGALKASAGKTWTCADRHDGNGLRWYQN